MISRKTAFSLEQLKEFDNHLMVVAFDEKQSGLQGFIAIHNTHLGPALGGTRFQSYSSKEAALGDVLNLSKAMSYKCAMAGLPFGGAKGVVINTPNMDKNAAFQRYAEIVEELRGLFKTGTDVGIYDTDVVHMAQFTSHMLGVVPGDRGDMSTSSIAALGVYYSVRASLAHRYGNDNPKGVSIGVKGVGKLGGELVRLLYADGALLTVADVDTNRCKEIVAAYPGVQSCSPDIIHTLPFQVYAPCALGNEFTKTTIKQLKTDIIAGGANNQLAHDDIGEQLHKLDILYAPDYIANAGGLIYVADELESDGFKPQRVLRRTKAIGKTLREVYAAAAEQHKSTNEVAGSIAQKRMKL